MEVINLVRGRTPSRRPQGDEEDQRVSVYTRLPLDLHNRVVEFYEEEERSIAWLIKEAVALYLDAYDELGSPPKQLNFSPDTVEHQAPTVMAPPAKRTPPPAAFSGNTRVQPGAHLP